MNMANSMLVILTTATGDGDLGLYGLWDDPLNNDDSFGFNANCSFKSEDSFYLNNFHTRCDGNAMSGIP